MPSSTPSASPAPADKCGRCGHTVDMRVNFLCGYGQINSVRYCHPQDPAHHDGDCYTITLRSMNVADFSDRSAWMPDTGEVFDVDPMLPVVPAQTHPPHWLNLDQPEPSAAELAEYVLARTHDREFMTRFLAAIEGRIHD